MQSSEMYEEAILQYTEGDSFTLMGVEFVYNPTTNFYETDGTVLYPNELILTLNPTVTTDGTYNVLLGGGDTQQNEIWMTKNNNNAVSGIRFDNSVVRGMRSQEDIYEIHLKESDKSILLNGEPPISGATTYQGTMKVRYINGRDTSYHPECNKVLKIKVR